MPAFQPNKWVSLAAATACLMGGVWLGRAWQTNPPADLPVGEKVAAVESTPGIVHLTETKRLAAGIVVAPAELRPMHKLNIVPGRLQYDDTRHVEIKAATDGVLTRLLVKTGDRVESGQVLAVLSSPEVGTARADVLQRRSELELAKKSLSWKEQTSDGVADLVSAIEERLAMNKLETKFKDRRLGEFRALLLSAYSRFLLAERLASKITSAAESGAVSNRQVSERTSERESAEETLLSVCEQSAFDTQRAKETAVAAVQDARRRYDISRHHLTSLLGYEEAGKDPASADQEGLSLVEMRAPFAGTIEDRVFGITERLRQGDRQFVLADTRRLWVVADLREADWPALALKTGQTLAVETPALPGAKLQAKVYFVGREVSLDSNAIPLVATIDNSDELLRPGLFVRVLIPLETDEEVLAVPSGAVVEHERQRFVFVAEPGDHYRRVDVKTGREESDWIEIRSGLSQGARVAAAGAFALKSELLLEREE